jgi:hypothetical protein
MTRTKNKSLELAEHFSGMAKTPPDGMVAVRFDIHQRGSLALIQLPYAKTEVQFGIAARAIRMESEKCAVNCLFFDKNATFESFQGDNDFYLRKLGLQRIPAGA